MSEIILWEDKEYVEKFQQLTELFRTRELENFNRHKEYDAEAAKIKRLVKKGEIDSAEAEARMDAFADKMPKGTPDLMVKIGNCAGAMAYRIYELYGENPDFETIEKNLKIEIPYGEVPEEIILENRFFLMLAKDRYVKTDNLVYVFQEEGFSVYPNVDAVLAGLKETGIKELVGIEELQWFAKDGISGSEPEVQAQSFALSLYGPEILRQRYIASRKGQPGSQE